MELLKAKIEETKEKAKQESKPKKEVVKQEIETPAEQVKQEVVNDNVSIDNSDSGTSDNTDSVEEKPKAKSIYEYAKENYINRNKKREQAAPQQQQAPNYDELLKRQTEAFERLLPKQESPQAPKIPDPLEDPEGYDKYLEKKNQDKFTEYFQKEIEPIMNFYNSMKKEREYGQWIKQRDAMFTKDPEFQGAMDYMKGAVLAMAEQQGVSEAQANEYFSNIEAEEVFKAKKLAYENGFTTPQGESMFIRSIMLAHAANAGFNYGEYQQYVSPAQEAPQEPTLNERRGLKERAFSTASLPSSSAANRSATGSDKALADKYLSTPMNERRKLFTKEETAKVMAYIRTKR